VANGKAQLTATSADLFINLHKLVINLSYKMLMMSQFIFLINKEMTQRELHPKGFTSAEAVI
jgi:hypothetical protein